MPKSTKAAPQHSNERATIPVAAIHKARLIMSVLLLSRSCWPAVYPGRS
jgi:hypothetical protein